MNAHIRRHACCIVAIAMTIALTGCGGSPSEPVIVTPSSTSTSETVTPPESNDLEERSRVEAIALDAVTLRLTPEWTDLADPLLLTGAADGSDRVFIVEQSGRIIVTRPGESRTSTFLDLRDAISTGGERGLLGMAVSPRYADNGTVYVNYTDTRGDTVVARYRVSSADPDSLDPDSGEVLLRVEQPFSNHNGGGIVFGPDDMLWIGMGDGGSAGDPAENGQNPDSLLGAMLRLDVGETADGNPEGAYAIPADNPFVGRVGYRPEIWGLGLRNPWRFSFDSATGDLWIGDVGQGEWEEIDFIAAADLKPGANFGWDVLEGTHPYPADIDPGDISRFTPPMVEYDHDAGRSVTGGVVYRGAAYPGLDGVYLYADFYGRIWGLRPDGDTPENVSLWTGDALIASFGVDDAGEVYVCDLGGTVYRVEFDVP